MAPVLWMLASTVIYGLYPLIAYSASSLAHPVFVIVLAHSAATIAQFIYLLIAAKREGKSAIELLRTVTAFRKVKVWALAQGIVHSFAHMSLFAAFIFLDKYAATLVYDAWPILMILMAPVFLPRKLLPNLREAIFIGISFLGLFLILAAKVDFSGTFSSVAETYARGSGLGSVIALISMIGMAFTAVAAVRLERLSMAAYRHRSIIGIKTADAHYRVTGLASKPFSSAIVSPFMGNAVSMVFSALIAVIFFASSDTQPLRDPSLSLIALIGIAAGVVAATAQICFIVANRSTNLTSINVLYNLTPLFGIFFLYAFGANETIEGQILLGGMLVIASNLAISVDAEITSAYYVSIASICIVAVYCYFIPGGEVDAYYSAIAVPAGIFAILIAFMTERLSVRQLRQEDLAIRIFEFSGPEASEIKDRNELRQAVYQILVSNSAQFIRDSTSEFVKRYRSRSPQITALMARLATNRIRIFGFGEIFVLWLIGSATLGLALFGRPASVEANILTVVLAATVSFLCALVVEPVNARRANLLFDLVGELPESSEGTESQRESDIDFVVLACISAVFALILFALFYLSMVNRVY